MQAGWRAADECAGGSQLVAAAAAVAVGLCVCVLLSAREYVRAITFPALTAAAGAVLGAADKRGGSSHSRPRSCSTEARCSACLDGALPQMAWLAGGVWGPGVPHVNVERGGKVRPARRPAVSGLFLNVAEIRLTE